jgi:hypothetical protein
MGAYPQLPPDVEQFKDSALRKHLQPATDQEFDLVPLIDSTQYTQSTLILNRTRQFHAVFDNFQPHFGLVSWVVDASFCGTMEPLFVRPPRFH